MSRSAYRLGLVYVFLAMGNLITLKTYADAAFLSAYGVRYLPHFTIAATAAFVLASAAYGSLVKRAPTALLDALLLVILGGLCVLVPLFAATRGPAQFVLLTLVSTVGAIVNLAAWNAVARTVTGREIRKLLPRAGAAATTGAVVAGFGSTALAAHLGIEHLPEVCVALTIAMLGAGLEVARRTAEHEADRPSAPTTDTSHRPGLPREARRLVTWLLVAAFAEAATGTVIEFLFKAQLKTTYGRNEIGVFIAAFYGVTNAGVLLLQLFAVPQLLATRSLGFSFSFHPAALLAVFGAWLVVPVLSIAAFARTLDAILKFSMSRASQEIALSPLSPEGRAQWKILLRGGATQVGAATAGLLLIVAAPFARRSPWALLVLGGVLTILWLLAVRSAARAYLTSLAATLGMRRLALDSGRTTDTGLDREGFRELVALCGHRDGRVARFGAAMLARVCQRSSELLPHLSSPSPTIRAALFAVAARRPDRAAATDLCAAVLAEKNDFALAAGFDALAAHADTGAVPAARTLADRADELGRAARTFLAQVGALDAEAAWSVAKETLDLDGPRAAAVLEAELARGRRRIDELDLELARRMRSPDDRAKREAFLAAATLAAPISAAPYLAALEAGDPFAVGALSDAGGPALKRLEAALQGTSGTAHARNRLARALRSNDAPESHDLLLTLLTDDDSRVREAAARSLARWARDRRIAVPRRVLARALNRELDALAIYVAARAPFWIRPAFQEDELQRQAGFCLGRVLAVAALGGHAATVSAAERRLRSGNEDERRGALDLLQEVARGDTRRRLLEVVEGYLAPANRTPSAAALQDVMTIDPWLRRVLGGELDTTRSRLIALRLTPIFQDIPGDALALLAEAASEIRALPGEVVVRQGEPGEALYVVEHGSLEVGDGSQPGGRIEAGSCFGELSLIDGAPRTVTVRAAAPSRLLRLPRAAFHEALERSPATGVGLLVSLARWLRGADASVTAASRTRTASFRRMSTLGHGVAK